MKRCKNCDREIIKSNQNARNIAYCCKECRIDFSRNNPSPSRTKEARDKYNHERCNKKADGKFKCPYCDGWYFALLRHVSQIHKINEKEFKIEFGLKSKSSFIQEDEREIKRESIKKLGITNILIKNGIKTRFKKGQRFSSNKRRTKIDYR